MVKQKKIIVGLLISLVVLLILGGFGYLLTGYEDVNYIEKGTIKYLGISKLDGTPEAIIDKTKYNIPNMELFRKLEVGKTITFKVDGKINRERNIKNLWIRGILDEG